MGWDEVEEGGGEEEFYLQVPSVKSSVSVEASISDKRADHYI